MWFAGVFFVYGVTQRNGGGGGNGRHAAATLTPFCGNDDVGRPITCLRFTWTPQTLHRRRRRRRRYVRWETASSAALVLAVHHPVASPPTPPPNRRFVFRKKKSVIFIPSINYRVIRPVVSDGGRGGGFDRNIRYKIRTLIISVGFTSGWVRIYFKALSFKKSCIGVFI